jgi:pilus assembly protein Flp/PilA
MTERMVLAGKDELTTTTTDDPQLWSWRTLIDEDSVKGPGFGLTQGYQEPAGTRQRAFHARSLQLADVVSAATQSISSKGKLRMLKYCIKTREAVKRLRTDKDGVVSFEYVIVVFCIVGAVALAFPGNIGLVLTNAITAIGTAVAAAT